MYQGSCLCGKVQFNIDGQINNIIYCHCSLCRKAQGSAFATNGIVKTENFNFISGEENLSAYESTAGQNKYFCKTCGSPIISRTKAKPEEVRIRLGTLSSDIIERPMAHIFASSKANWEDICGDLPQYNEYDPGRNK
ncbi:MAG: GFA family protein [Pseudomonadota bacterium]